MSRLASFGRFFPYLRPYRLRMAAAALLVMSAAGTNLSMLWVIRRLVDTVLVQRDPAALNTAIAELGALFLVQGLLIMGHSYLTASAGQRIIADFRMHLFNHLQSLSLGFFARRRTGELMSRLMNDVGALQTTLTEIPIDLAKQVVTLVGGLTILFVMNWRLCLLILLLLPAIVLVARFFGRRLKALSTAIQDETARASTILGKCSPASGSSSPSCGKTTRGPGLARRSTAPWTSSSGGRGSWRSSCRRSPSPPSPPRQRSSGTAGPKSSEGR